MDVELHEFVGVVDEEGDIQHPLDLPLGVHEQVLLLRLFLQQRHVQHFQNAIFDVFT